MTYLTIKQAAAYLQVPHSVIYCKWRLFGGVKIGKHVRIPQEGIDEYMGSQRQRGEGIQQKRRCTPSMVIQVNPKEYIRAARHLSKRFLKSVGMIPEKNEGVV